MAVSRESGFFHVPSELQKQEFQEDRGGCMGCPGWAFANPEAFLTYSSREAGPGPAHTRRGTEELWNCDVHGPA